ncbi:MAG TPA: hypothetical protein VJR29_01555 [bacterium]|nr:hypothetical protein [bacterium]
MKRGIAAILLCGILSLAGAGELRADFYDEACQTIALQGKVELPPDFPKEEPLQLTLSFQLNYQKAPSYLLVNLPTGQAEYKVTIVGYRKKDPGAHEIPQIFLYPRPVIFRYYVESRDGRWKSKTHQSTWQPAVAKPEDVAECQPDFYLDALKLAKKPL